MFDCIIKSHIIEQNELHVLSVVDLVTFGVQYKVKRFVWSLKIVHHWRNDAHQV